MLLQWDGETKLKVLSSDCFLYKIGSSIPMQHLHDDLFMMSCVLKMSVTILPEMSAATIINDNPLHTQSNIPA